jgi:molybdopterin-biosynthesis enzyme MoeA-like protein
MTVSSVRTRTKDDLRAEAIERFKVSKNAFDFAWISAIERTGNRHWYEPLPRSRKKTGRMPLA